jgi:hypothetical protein
LIHYWFARQYDLQPSFWQSNIHFVKDSDKKNFLFLFASSTTLPPAAADAALRGNTSPTPYFAQLNKLFSSSSMDDL